MTRILVTGASGTVGQLVLEALRGRPGVEVLAAVRSPANAAAVKARGATAVAFDYGDLESMKQALDGVERVFFLSPPGGDPAPRSAAFLEIAKGTGARHVVELSALGCDREAIALGRAHRAVEKLVESSGLAWTFVRPNNFMENFLGVRHGLFAPNADGEIRLPWGEAACSFVAARDIAAVAAAALTEAGHAGRAHEVTGPEALTMTEVAAALTAASGKTIRYVDVPEAEARATLAKAHLPAPVIEGLLEIHAIGKAGRAAVVTDTVAAVTGRAATSFSAFATSAFTTAGA